MLSYSHFLLGSLVSHQKTSTSVATTNKINFMWLFPLSFKQAHTHHPLEKDIDTFDWKKFYIEF